MMICEGGLDHPAVIALLRLHLERMHDTSPPDSVHALDLSGLKAPGVRFWAAWDGDTVMGCGAMKRHDATLGEVKSMRTADAYLQKGVGAALLAQIIAAARAEGLTRLSLETGSGPAFEPAHALYRRFGFVDCGPFADYPTDDPFSRFMTLALSSTLTSGSSPRHRP